MKKTKIVILVIIVGVLSSLSLNANATGIPVVDLMANVRETNSHMQQVAQWAKEAQQWIQTVDHYKQQIQAYKSQLSTVTGIRDVKGYINSMQDFINDAKSQGEDFESIISDVKSKNYQDFLAKAQNKLDEYGVFDTCKDISDTKLKNTCTQQRLQAGVTMVKYDQYGKELQKTRNTLNKLAQKINNTKDIKESQDIANAIQLTGIRLQEKKQEIDMANKSQDLVDKIASQQKEETFIKNMQSSTFVNPAYH